MDLTGRILDGKYQIEKKLGEGGMGAVFRATHLGTERPVAVKVITPQFMQEERFVERFKREAKAAGRLRHPNVVNVTDFGFAQENGERLAYLVMEYLDGQSLGDLLKEHRHIPLEVIIEIIEQVSVAVSQAHKQGIIHRDLKPDNIWLQPDGRGKFNVKVLDFGLAKILDDAPIIVGLENATDDKINIALEAATVIKSGNETETIISPATGERSSQVQTMATGQEIPASAIETVITDPGGQQSARAGELQMSPNKLTKAGSILGTPPYMSPEQCQGKTLDARTDIYSLGIIVYEMVAGKPPFSGSLRQLLHDHIEKPPPALTGAPPAVTRIVMSALAKNPDDRPTTANAFATALRANHEGEAPILSAAFDHFRTHLRTLITISFFTLLPYFIINYLFIALAFANLLPAAISGLMQRWYWLVSFGLVLFANLINSGAFTTAVGQWLISPDRKVSVLASVSAFYRQSLPLIATMAIFFTRVLAGLVKLVLPGMRAFIDYSLFAPVMAVERQSGGAALARSQQLVARLRVPIRAIQLRNLLITGLVTLAMPLSLVSLSFGSTLISEERFELIISKSGAIPASLFIPLSATLLPWLFLTVIFPIGGVAQAICYFKVRKASGEIVNEQANSAIDLTPSINRSAISLARALAMCAALIVALAAWLVLKDIALNFAAGSGLTTAVEALLITGANANGKVRPELFTDYETTPLVSAVDNDTTAVVELLLKMGADPSLANNYGWTPLMEAVKKSNMEVVQLLIEKGAAVNARNSFGFTPLLIAATTGDEDFVAYLLEHGAEVNAVNVDGDTALIIAVRGGHVYAAQRLLEHGAEVDVVNKFEGSAISIAEEGGDSYLIDLLKRHSKQFRGSQVIDLPDTDK